MNCPACAFDNPTGHRFCGRCGAALPTLCPACGAANDAAYRFCGECGTELAGRERSSEAGVAPTTATGVEPERRQISILFCDLVGSTELSHRLDPEDLRDVISAYRDMVAEAVHAFGGLVARFLGDGVLVYFGYPSAGEDDALRAVLAARRIVATLARVSARKHDIVKSPLRVRIGIHTGLVVAGDLSTGASHESMAVVGEAPNVAARLHEMAPPDGIVVGPLTARLVGSRVTLRALGAQRLKGLAIAVEAHLVVSDAPEAPRAPAFASGPIFGRDLDQGLLWDRWRRAAAGAGQAVVISGESGIGKSRLVHALRDRVGLDARWIHCAASSFTARSMLAPFVDLLRRRLAQARAVDADTDPLPAVIGAASTPETRAVFADLLGPPPEGEALGDGTAQRRRRRTLQLLASWLLADDSGEPVVLVIEDVQWLDASSQNLLDIVLTQLAGKRTLLLLTGRPEATAHWISKRDVTHLQLGPLPAAATEELVRHVAGTRVLDQATLDAILRKTDGVPLFVEELTRAVVETGAPELAHDASGTAVRRNDGVPGTLRDSLMARLDRLNPAKLLAQIAAVAGRSFSFAALRAVAPGNPDEIEIQLGVLVDNGILQQQGFPPDATYAFRHALIRDTAYESLLLSRRQQVHRQLARYYLSAEAALVASRPELVATHFAAAGDVAEAVNYLTLAGRVAAARSANVEAHAHFTEALRLAARIPDAATRDDRELDLRIGLGAVDQAIQGYAGDAALRSFDRALALCRARAEQGPRLFSALWGLSGLYLVKAPLPTARRLIEELLAVARREGDAGRHIESQRRLGWVLFLQGDMAGADRELIGATFALIEAEKRPLPTLHGSHPLAGALSNRALLEWYLGRPQDAVASAERALAAVAAVGSPFSEAYSLGVGAMVHQLVGDARRVRALADPLARISRDQEFPYWEAWASLFEGWADAAEGDLRRGLATVERALAAYLRTGARQLHPYAAALLAELQLRAGASTAARATLDGVPVNDPDFFQYHTPELLRLRGDLDALDGEGGPSARAFYRRALSCALGQHALGPALRVVSSLRALGAGADPELGAQVREMLGRLPGNAERSGAVGELRAWSEDTR